MSELKGAGKVCSPALGGVTVSEIFCPGAHIIELADPFGRLKPGLQTFLRARACSSCAVC